jgi:hypothetical protein
MAKFYGTKLSDNMKLTPEGYLVCFNAVIARTGYQTYAGSELPEDELKEQNVSVNPDDQVKVLRLPEEVFKTSVFSSFEGKPFTFHHPEELLKLDTVNDFQCGHIQNVRKGEEPFENGDWPLLADIVVTDKETIYAIRVLGIRELSCGYNYRLLKDGNNLLQVAIIGNHVALVENGRAGAHAKIQDSLKRNEINMSRMTGSFLRALGLHSLAKTVTPEEFAVALDAAKEEPKPEGKDAKHGDGCECPTCKPKAKDKKPKAKDAMSKDDEKQLAGLLAGGSGAIKSKATPGLDADDPEVEGRQAGELEVLSEEEEEEGERAEAEDDDDDTEGEAATADDDDDDAEAEDDDDMCDDDDDIAADDSAVESEASPEILKHARFKTLVPSATDSAYRRGKMDAIKALKPFVARSGNKQLVRAMDSAIKQITARPVSKGGYGKFSAGAKARGASAQDSMNQRNDAEKKIAAINAEYRKLRGTNVVKK